MVDCTAETRNSDKSGADRPGADRPGTGERRIVALDGLRGLMTLMVIVSHYFGELPHGVRGTTFGWIAVEMFFVLSGFLIGKLILEKCHHANFFAVFYVRRFCRIIPAYIVTICVLSLLLGVIAQPWADADHPFPLWTYLTFVQGIWMVQTQTIGAHWLAPTWTLAVEEHFYLLVPACIVFTPRRLLAPVLLAAAAVAFGLRVAVYAGGIGNEFLALALLPGRMDELALGVLAALALQRPGMPWSRLMLTLRMVPVIGLTVACLLYLSGPLPFGVFGPLVVGVGCACYLLGIVLGAPEAKRFHSRTLQFFGNNGYCLYLTHLPILGLMHGLILGTRPDLATPAQWVVTIASLAPCVLVGWGMTKLIEEPLARYGRSWRWSAQSRRGRSAIGAATSQPQAELSGA